MCNSQHDDCGHYMDDDDSDVVIILLSQFLDLNMEKVLVDYGTGTHRRILPIHTIVQELDPDKCLALPLITAFSGCETVSSFSGKAKKTAWSPWCAHGDVTVAFQNSFQSTLR